MESASVPAPSGSVEPAGSAPGDKGLKTGALGFVQSTVIGVASTAPGYSLAASLGLVVAVGGIGLQSPAIFVVSFIPMLFIATAYYYMNRADPDCGTTFSWVTRAMGPQLGWVAGWAIVVADIIVMANLSQIAGLYTFKLFDSAAEPAVVWVTLIGIVWIVVMTAICVIGIELSARTQVGLLSAEIVTLVVFAVVALVKVWGGDAGPDAIDPSLSWLNPFDIPLGNINPISASPGPLVGGVLIAVFIYWGWDSTVTVNEETEDSSTTPGRAAIVSTVLLLAIYVIVSVAAQAYAGPQELIDNADEVLSALGTDVFGSPLDKILIIAVLTSAAASTQTTILPTARTTLSMARQHAMPKALGNVHPRFQTPHVSTILMGLFSIIWYVFLTIVSTNILSDSIAALGLMIAFYYGLTGFACVIYYRHELFKSVKNFVFVGLAPLVGALMLTYLFVKSCAVFTNPDCLICESGDSWLGVAPPLIIGGGFIALGVILMAVTWISRPEFFRRGLETVPPEVAAEAPGAPKGGS